MAGNLGLTFTFRDAGDYVGSPALAPVHSLGTTIRAVRYNRNGNRYIGIDLFDKAGNKWNNIATFNQKQGDWGYNVGDVAISVEDDGTVMLMTNAGEPNGNEIKEAWVRIPPHLTGIPATDFKQAVNFTTATVDQFARDQISGIKQSANAATNAANQARDAANNMTALVKSEIDKKLKNFTGGMTEKQVKDIVWSIFADRLFVEIINETSALHQFVDATAQYWGWLKGKDAAFATLVETKLIKDPNSK